ncbi:hypothetical protein N825_14845 [Skermanella stibiiresistens SB22]|uniref:Uncharacterized protein n=1 Tax=Skermanella stibiiresistens SB22 TaxID=1385369 RepID=W9GWM3_9PROT|nr:hypothetical protein [Skermanella stibiiresistens]EWY38184.1 hypothetical protein N825_14845 [Skermanella stibiiresistens SB22]
MVDTRPTGPNTNLPVRADAGSGRASPGRAVEELRAKRSHSGRVPSLKQLASLMVDGILTLPSYYRRGMYLDLLV